MRNILIGLLVLTVPAATAAEGPEGTRTYNGGYYAFLTTGSCQHDYPFYGVGGGAEGLIWRGLTVGVEASYQHFRNSFSFGLATFQAGYHFRGKNRSAKWDPFATYGLGVGLANSFAGSGSLGGGVIYWLKDRVGVRFEGRLQGVACERLATMRVGVSFR